jgi:hypothetical protein
MEPKIIQIIADKNGNVASLDELGNVWMLNLAKTKPQWDLYVPNNRERIRDV